MALGFPVQVGKVGRVQNAKGSVTGQRPEAVEVWQKIFRHEAHLQPEFLQGVVQDVEVWRFQAAERGSLL